MRGRAMRVTELTLAALLCAALAAGTGCGGGQSAEPTPTPTISPSPIPTGIFEIYLVNTFNLSQINFSNLDSIPLQDEPILSATDITSYNWSNHSIKLTDVGCAQLEKALSETAQTAFVAMANGERLYWGLIRPYFWLTVSSYIPECPVIVYSKKDLGETLKCNYSNTVRIQCAWSGCEELRNSETIYMALKQAGILIE